MSENTNMGPSGAISSAMPVTPHEHYGYDDEGGPGLSGGSVGGGVVGPTAGGANMPGDRGPEGSKGLASTTGSPVNAGDMV